MSKLFWAMLSFITRLPVPRRWSQGLDFEHYSRGIITCLLYTSGALSGRGWFSSSVAGQASGYAQTSEGLAASDLYSSGKKGTGLTYCRTHTA